MCSLKYQNEILKIICDTLGAFPVYNMPIQQQNLTKLCNRITAMYIRIVGRPIDFSWF